MSTSEIEDGDPSPRERSHLRSAIVFGSASSHPVRKPAGLRAACEAIDLPRSTYYYQSHRSTEEITLEQKIEQPSLDLRASHPNDGYRVRWLP